MWSFAVIFRRSQRALLIGDLSSTCTRMGSLVVFSTSYYTKKNTSRLFMDATHVYLLGLLGVGGVHYVPNGIATKLVEDCERRGSRAKLPLYWRVIPSKRYYGDRQQFILTSVLSTS